MLNKVISLAMIIIVSCSLILTKALAQENQFSLEKNLKYTIILELNQAFAYKIKDVYVIGTEEIDKKSFLPVRIKGLVKESTALISLDCVKTIIPQIEVSRK